MSENKSSNKDLTSAERQQILQTLLEQYDGGKLKKGDITTIADSFNVHRNTIGRLWKRANQSVKDGSDFMDVSSRKTNCGRKKREIDMNDVTKVPLSKRGTIRSTAAAFSIPKSTLYRKFQRHQLKWDK